MSTALNEFFTKIWLYALFPVYRVLVVLAFVVIIFRIIPLVSGTSVSDGKGGSSLSRKGAIAFMVIAPFALLLLLNPFTVIELFIDTGKEWGIIPRSQNIELQQFPDDLPTVDNPFE